VQRQEIEVFLHLVLLVNPQWFVVVIKFLSRLQEELKLEVVLKRLLQVLRTCMLVQPQILQILWVTQPKARLLFLLMVEHMVVVVQEPIARLV
jgi:hypothetical protein